MNPLVRFAAVLVLVLSLGLHWAFLQSVAWVGMIANFSRDASLTEAVSKTFDGEHPCCLCKAIKKGRAEEKQQEQKQLKPGSKLDHGLVWQTVNFDFSAAPERIGASDRNAESRRDEPPKPRPRFLPLRNLA